MPKWNISLIPGTEKQARSIEVLPEPFGFCRDVDAPQVEQQNKKEMI